MEKDLDITTFERKEYLKKKWGDDGYIINIIELHKELYGKMKILKL